MQTCTCHIACSVVSALNQKRCMCMSYGLVISVLNQFRRKVTQVFQGQTFEMSLSMKKQMSINCCFFGLASLYTGNLLRWMVALLMGMTLRHEHWHQIKKQKSSLKSKLMAKNQGNRIQNDSVFQNLSLGGPVSPPSLGLLKWNLVGHTRVNMGHRKKTL